ncbi:Copia protein, partial [Mucuna pruriens]
MNVHNVSLHNDLDKEVYMQLPLSFSFGDSKKLCKLQNNEVILIILVYVNDLKLQQTMKTLGKFKVFVGLEWKYALDIILETRLLGAKPIGLPLEQNHRLALTNGAILEDLECYHRLVPHPQPMQLYYDSQVIIHIVVNPMFHERTKHIKVDRHYIHDEIQDDNIVKVHVRTYNQLADILTKALGKHQFDFLLGKLGTRPLL